jgi:hypothetical protein
VIIHAGAIFLVSFDVTPCQETGAARDGGFELEEFYCVQRSRYVIQCGYAWPTLLTPAIG